MKQFPIRTHRPNPLPPPPVAFAPVRRHFFLPRSISVDFLSFFLPSAAVRSLVKMAARKWAAVLAAVQAVLAGFFVGELKLVALSSSLLLVVQGRCKLCRHRRRWVC